MIGIKVLESVKRLISDGFRINNHVIDFIPWIRLEIVYYQFPPGVLVLPDRIDGPTHPCS
jgi:hypothetical protein